MIMLSCRTVFKFSWFLFLADSECSHIFVLLLLFGSCVLHTVVGLFVFVTHWYVTSQKMKFSIKDFFSKCDQIRSFLRIWSHLLKKSLMETSFFCAICRSFIQGTSGIVGFTLFREAFSFIADNRIYLNVSIGHLDLRVS